MSVRVWDKGVWGEGVWVRVCGGRVSEGECEGVGKM